MSQIGDRIEQLRGDSAWKELKLSNKALVLLKEYLDLLEQLQAHEEDIHNLRSDAAWKNLSFVEKLIYIIEEYFSLYENDASNKQLKIVPGTISELVRQNYWELIKSIVEIARGNKPTEADLHRISVQLGMNFNEVKALADSSFPTGDQET
ncbi:hypothetical protein G7B40_039930 [Aetokthonos hydrillicola Thurmond2011]|uniref:Uncharacterized protein n=1 Tax=Aetokthonos hydrillicola Thurmond2011 TaxID=2712845 RepID=A0AAP5IFJ1_9CYAN|nr:hypothetical protein [Aetokthonos hydrillicola]MBW4590108.1 hypothetical protein [Aetokthonos hydrillicola CCALA 1050]MDR9900661.1 hypothetical protein [Aetokthonos hydrillicola Thurmond2011]